MGELVSPAALPVPAVGVVGFRVLLVQLQEGLAVECLAPLVVLLELMAYLMDRLREEVEVEPQTAE